MRLTLLLNGKIYLFCWCHLEHLVKRPSFMPTPNNFKPNPFLNTFRLLICRLAEINEAHPPPKITDILLRTHFSLNPLADHRCKTCISSIYHHHHHHYHTDPHLSQTLKTFSKWFIFSTNGWRCRTNWKLFLLLEISIAPSPSLCFGSRINLHSTTLMKG